MTTPPIVYLFDEDGYFRYAKEAQRSPNPETPDKFLIPVRSTQVKPEIPEGYEGKWDGEKWNYEKIPTSAADFVGVKISHKSQTEHFRRMRKLLQDFVKADSEHYRVIRGSKEEGLYWSVEVIPEKTQDEKDLEAAKQEEQELLQKLRDTDYIAVKIAEGAVTEEEAPRYEEIKAQRQEWRDQVNALRVSQGTLTAKIAEADA